MMIIIIIIWFCMCYVEYNTYTVLLWDTLMVWGCVTDFCASEKWKQEYDCANLCADQY